jgi:hypothetical protein
MLLKFWPHASTPLSCFVFFFLGGIGASAKGLMLGPLPLKPCFQLFLALVIFQIGSCFLPGPPWATVLLTVSPKEKKKKKKEVVSMVGDILLFEIHTSHFFLAPHSVSFPE